MKIHVNDLAVRRLDGEPGTHGGLIEIDVTGHPVLYQVRVTREDWPPEREPGQSYGRWDYTLREYHIVPRGEEGISERHQPLSTWFLRVAAIQFVHVRDEFTMLGGEHEGEYRVVEGYDDPYHIFVSYHMTGKPCEQVPDEFRSFTTRTANSLMRGGFRTLGDVAAATDEQLLAIRNFGRRTLAEVRAVPIPYDELI